MRRSNAFHAAIFFSVTLDHTYVPHRQKRGARGVVIWVDITMDHHDQSKATDFSPQS